KPPRMRSTHCRVATGLSAWGAGAVVKFASLHFAKTSKHHQEERHVEPQNVRIIRGGQRRRATIGSRPARSAPGPAGGADRRHPPRSLKRPMPGPPPRGRPPPPP